MNLSIEVRSDNFAVVVALAGAADAARLEQLRDPLTAALLDAGLVVLDLDELTTVDPGGLRAMIVDVPATARGGKLHIAARHAPTVATLARARIHHLVAVHRSVTDALPDDLGPGA